MLNRRIIILVAILLLITLALLNLWGLRPAIVSITPAHMAINQSRQSVITVTFTRSMRPDTVLEAFHIEPAIEGEIVFENKTLIFTPTQPWPKDERITIRFEEGAQSRIFLPLILSESHTFQTAPIRLAYLWPAGQAANLYALDPHSGNIQQLTTLNSVLDYHVVSDTQIYFSAKNDQFGSDLYQLNIYTGEMEMILLCGETTCSDVQANPAGQTLAYIRHSDDINALWILDMATNTETKISLDTHDARLPLWAADGRLSYYDVTDAGYRFVNLDTGDIIRWSNALGEAGVWQPNGVAFLAPAPVQVETDALRGPTGEASNDEVDEENLSPVIIFTTHLIEFKFNSRTTENLTSVKLWEDTAPSYSEDGQWLVFARRDISDIQAATARQVWVVRANGTEARALTDDAYYKYLSFSWHPDGGQIAVIRFNNITLTDPPEIWLIDTSTGEKIRLIIDGFSPQWIP